MYKLRSIFGHSSYRASTQTASAESFLKRHSGFEIAGVFILLALLLLAIAAFSLSNSNKQAVHKDSASQPASLQIKSNEASNANSQAVQTPVTSQSNSVSTNVTSNTDANGNTSTHVTVNGHPVNVPQNGSTHQDFGNTHVDISNNQTSTGSATNTDVSNTFTNVQSSTDSSVSTEVDN